MNLNDFFEDHSQKRTSQVQKMRIYNNFLDKKHNKSILSRTSFYWKVSVYSLFMIFLLFSFYTPWSGNYGQPNQTKLAQDPNITKANYIGKIIEVSGDLKLYKDGQEHETDFIEAGDNIIIDKNSEVVFEVGSGIISKIQGPAEFQVYYKNNNKENDLIVNLKKGKQIKINSENTLNNRLILRTKDFEITSQKNEKIDFEINHDKESQYINNRGNNLSLSKSTEDQKASSQIEKNQRTEIDKEIKKLTQQLKNKQLETEYEITGGNLSYNNESNSSNNKDSQDLLKDNDIISESSQENITSLNIDSQNKKVIPKEKLNKLKNILHDSFVKRNIKDVVVYHFKGDKNSQQIANSNLLSRLVNIYDIFEFDINSQIVNLEEGTNKIDTKELMIITDQLISKIQNKYYIPDKNLVNLKLTLSWLVIIEQYETGKFQNEKDLEIIDIINKLGLEGFSSFLNIK